MLDAVDNHTEGKGSNISFSSMSGLSQRAIRLAAGWISGKRNRLTVID
jgi:hypothetical protein